MKKAALAVLFLSMAAIATAFATAIAAGRVPVWTAWVMAVATSCSMIAIIVLGAARTGRPFGGLRRVLAPFAVVLLILLAAFAAALLLPSAAEPLLLGLPRRAAIVLYGIGVLPALILPIAYALTFDELTLSEEDVERVREVADRAEREP